MAPKQFPHLLIIGGRQGFIKYYDLNTDQIVF